MEACPIILAMLSMGIPALSVMVPKVCLAMWNDNLSLMPQALPTMLSLSFITLRLHSRGKISVSPFPFTAFCFPFRFCSSRQWRIMASTIGCSGTMNSTFVFWRSLRIYFLPSAAVWICLYCRCSISAIANPVKQEKTNISLACSASLSFIVIAMSFATSLFCRKRIFFSSFSYLACSKGL